MDSRHNLNNRRTTAADVGRFESERPARSKRDKIVSRWQMYLGTMIVKAAEDCDPPLPLQPGE
jgi:hypothetical protein